MVKEEKIKEVEELKKLMDDHSVIGLLDMHKLPSRQFQMMKKKLGETTVLKMSKKSLLILAMKGLNKNGIGEFEKLVPQQPALILSKTEPFKFYKMIGALKSSAFAKEGDITPRDIIVEAGPTSLPPGPAISELTKVGIPAGVEEGRIVVKKTATVAKKGDTISKPLAATLRKLKIEPIEIGLNVVAFYENGTVYPKDVLNLVNIYPEQLKHAISQALNLSISICYPTSGNIKYLLTKAYAHARALENLGGVK